VPIDPANGRTDLLEPALELVIKQSDVVPRTRAVKHGEVLSVGRAPDCSVCIDDLSISRKHLELRVSAEGVLVVDSSTNGTLADGDVLRQGSKPVAFGRPIVLGSTTLLLRLCTREDTLALPAAPAAGSGGAPPAPVNGGAHPYAERGRMKTVAVVPRFGTGGPNTGALATVQVPPVPPAPPVPPTPTPAAPSALFDDVRPGEVPIELRRQVHRMLLEHLDMNVIDPTRNDDPALRSRVLAALRRIARMLEPRLPAGLSPDTLVGEVADEALGLGPLERLLADPAVTEIMVVDAHHIFIEQDGRLRLSSARFTDEDRARAAIERIVTPLGRRIDESSPLVDARLNDGSRVNVVIKPLALRGSCITIRKFARSPITIGKLIEFGALNESMANFLSRSVRAKKNIVISGGTGSGKTTLLNVLSSAIPENERIVTIEDAAELQLVQPHVVSLESRPANMEGKGEISIRALVKNALRMRPDRIVVGECRGGEALDMLQAMNTGHDGSLTTTHANSPAEALLRLETLSLMAGVDLPAHTIREQIAKSVHLVVQQTRLGDGSRKITAISEIAALDRNGNLRLRPLFEYVRTGTAADGQVLGRFDATGYLPSFLPELVVMGLVKPGEYW
jgi:pilus assembly protein CpaF